MPREPAADASNLIREYLNSRKRVARLSDRVCIVTGAGSLAGIGRQTVIAFCENGAKAVYAADISSPDDFVSLLDATRQYETKVVTVECDASNEASVRNLCLRAVQECGRLDVFFANAGISSREYELEDVTPDEFMRVMQVNLLSCVLACKHAAEAMKVISASKPSPGGSIIMTASVAGMGGLGKASGPAYGASKAGVINLSRSLSWKLGRYGIRVNCVNPGLVQTSMNAEAFEKSAKRGLLPGVATTNALARHAIPEELANAVLFLASDDSSYITGQDLTVDGGWSASLPQPASPPKL